MTTKAKYRARPLPHTVTIHSVARDAYGEETETNTDVTAYVERYDKTRFIGQGQSEAIGGLVIVPGGTTVVVGDNITVGSDKRKIVDVSEIKGLRDDVFRKELLFAT
jgi:hypothetical protein